MRLLSTGSSTRSSRATSAALALALLAAPAPAHGAGKAEFVVSCRLDHRARTDPIVHPGKRVAGHMHDFFGNVATDGRSTNASLRRTRTSCTPAADRSAYWVPTLYDGGRAVRPSAVTVYYTTEPELAPALRPFPRNLRVVAGNARERGRVPGAPDVWSCLGGDVDSLPTIVTCPPGSPLELILNFPDCWDGRHATSGDHHSHMAYSVAKACPASHPVPVPQIQFKIRWPSLGGPGAVLASGPGYSAHGDFMNAWDDSALQRRIDTCLKAVIKCGADGRPL